MRENTRTLIQTLRKSGLGNGRYTNIKVINRDRATGDPRPGHQGVLSVVFRAYDQQSGSDVALKFFDPDLQGFGVRYRMDLFEREARLLEKLVRKQRFLQLVQPLSEIDITVRHVNGQSMTVKCGYFTLEWLEGDITEYFLCQDAFDALTKLALFRQVVLGVFLLHREDLAHRDIKYDNLRQTTKEGKETVIPIDFGTAIHLKSPPIGTITQYRNTVGASAFSPLEARVGLAGVRKTAIGTDVYALGCLLHDLFNVKLYSVRLFQDSGFRNCFSSCLSHMESIMLTQTDDDVLYQEFQHILRLTRNQVTLPAIDSDETTVPKSVSDQLNRLLHKLTDISFEHREYDSDRILKMIDSAVRSIENQLMNRHRSFLRDQRRKRREDKQRKQMSRLEQYLLAQ